MQLKILAKLIVGISVIMSTSASNFIEETTEKSQVVKIEANGSEVLDSTRDSISISIKNKSKIFVPKTLEKVNRFELKYKSGKPFQKDEELIKQNNNKTTTENQEPIQTRNETNQLVKDNLRNQEKNEMGNSKSIDNSLKQKKKNNFRKVKPKHLNRLKTLTKNDTKSQKSDSNLKYEPLKPKSLVRNFNLQQDFLQNEEEDLWVNDQPINNNTESKQKSLKHGSQVLKEKGNQASKDLNSIKDVSDFPGNLTATERIENIQNGNTKKQNNYFETLQHEEENNWQNDQPFYAQKEVLVKDNDGITEGHQTKNDLSQLNKKIDNLFVEPIPMLSDKLKFTSLIGLQKEEEELWQNDQPYIDTPYSSLKHNNTLKEIQIKNKPKNIPNHSLSKELLKVSSVSSYKHLNVGLKKEGNEEWQNDQLYKSSFDILTKPKNVTKELHSKKEPTQTLHQTPLKEMKKVSWINNNEHTNTGLLKEEDEQWQNDQPSLNLLISTQLKNNNFKDEIKPNELEKTIDPKTNLEEFEEEFNENYIQQLHVVQGLKKLQHILEHEEENIHKLELEKSFKNGNITTKSNTTHNQTLETLSEVEHTNLTFSLTNISNPKELKKPNIIGGPGLVVYKKKTYFLSWRRGLKSFSWEDAKRFCLKKGMKLVSLQDVDKLQHFFGLVAADNTLRTWTGGKMEGTNLKWLSGNSSELVSGKYPWSQKLRRPSGKREEENCVAIFNRIRKDGVRLHIVGCKSKMSFICEQQ